MKNSFKKHLRSFILVKNSPRHSAGDLGDDRLPPLLDSKMYQMYQTGTSNNPVFMRSGGFQRKFKDRVDKPVFTKRWKDIYNQ